MNAHTSSIEEIVVFQTSCKMHGRQHVLSKHFMYDCKVSNVIVINDNLYFSSLYNIIIIIILV